MDKKLNKRIEVYLTNFKHFIREQVLKIEPGNVSEFIDQVYGYERLTLTKEDVSKRRRIKNSIPALNRCSANRANGEQCTRKRKEGCEYCGTHVKGTPHGIISVDANPQEQTFKGEVFAEDICGIVYYIDKFNNIYKTEDVLNGVKDPKILTKCVKLDGKYAIPDFNLIPK